LGVEKGLKSYSVWYLERDLGIYGKVVHNRTVHARCIREASKKVREWSDRRDFLIVMKGTYVLEPGGGPLILLEKKVKTEKGVRYFKNIRIKMKNGMV